MSGMCARKDLIQAVEAKQVMPIAQPWQAQERKKKKKKDHRLLSYVSYIGKMLQKRTFPYSLCLC